MTELYWVDGPWPGKLTISSRPRGGDWLSDEVADWHRAGVDVVLSLLTSDEEDSLDLKQEAALASGQGMKFISFPIPDRQAPASPSELASVLENINFSLSSGKNVLIHCRQGVGRSGLVAACLLVTKGWEPAATVKHLSSVRRVPIPETSQQRQWLDHFTAVLAGTK